MSIARILAVLSRGVVSSGLPWKLLFDDTQLLVSFSYVRLVLRLVETSDDVAEGSSGCFLGSSKCLTGSGNIEVVRAAVGVLEANGIFPKCDAPLMPFEFLRGDEPD